MSSDLSKLRIDRDPRPPAKARGKRRGGLPWGTLVLVAVVVAGLWFARAPLGRMLDSFSLPEVEVVRVASSNPAAVGAVRGKAANGYIVAARRAALSADTPGRIEEMRVVEGSEVKKGEVVARLYSEEFEADVRTAEAELGVARLAVAEAQASILTAEAQEQQARSSAKAAREDVGARQSRRDLAAAEINRIRPLVEQGVQTAQDLDRAGADLADQEAQLRAGLARVEVAERAVDAAGRRRSELEQTLEVVRGRVATAQARADRAAATLAKTFVRAPFDGIVVLKDAEVGEVVSPNSQGGSNARGAVCTMVDFASLEVQAEVTETSLQGVRLDGHTSVFLDAYPDRRFGAVVSRIWPTANRQKGTVEVRLTFDQIDRLFRPEMGVRVVFLDPSEPPAGPEGSGPGDGEAVEASLLLSVEAVVRIEGRSGVFVLERDVVRWREVSLGERRSGKVVVEAGLSEDELVVVSPEPSLQDGDRVRRRR